MKRICAIVMSILLLGSLSATKVYAKNHDGNIDLYEVFSNKEDRMKTEVGSRIYKWSMHLPDDAVIYKSEQANRFNMSTTSYQSSVELEVEKNKDNLNLEELLYKLQNKKRRHIMWGNEEKELVVDINKDSSGEKYIRIIKANEDYDYFLVDDAAEEFREYIENRIYIKNNYIYNLTITMDGEFYRNHKEMFEKLISSFKLSFNEKNSYIKELSDSVSTTREFKNTSYGWKITMNPYWKVEGTPNARLQKFSPVYSDEELSMNVKIKEDKDEFKVPEGISVKLVSSADKGETAYSWAEEVVSELKNSYNSKVYSILKNESKTQDNMTVKHLVVSYKTVTKKPYIIHNMYVVGNGYKYLVSATMMEDKYKDNSKREAFEKMLNSFKLDNSQLSDNLGKIIAAKSLINLNQSKEIKMKKYSFKTNITKKWNVSNYRNGFMDGFYDDFYYEYAESMYRENISNNEYVDALEPSTNMILSMSAGLNTDEMKKIMEDRAEVLLRDDEIRMGLASVNIKSAEHNGAELYYIQKEYNLDAIKKFVNEDSTKIYDLEKLQNTYKYIVKIGKDTYVESITLPIANFTEKNKANVNTIWNNSVINGVNYSNSSLKWTDHKLEEFNKEK